MASVFYFFWYARYRNLFDNGLFEIYCSDFFFGSDGLVIPIMSSNCQFMADAVHLLLVFVLRDNWTLLTFLFT